MACYLIGREDYKGAEQKLKKAEGMPLVCSVKMPYENNPFYVMLRLGAYKVNQVLFTCEILKWGLQEPYRCDYFSLQTNHQIYLVFGIFYFTT